VKEELQATGNYHGELMDKSKARESCAFAKVLYHKKGGARGVRLDCKRIVSRKDVKNLIAGGKRDISHEVRKAFIDAHKGPIANLFAELEKDNDLFNYPFLLPTNQVQLMIMITFSIYSTKQLIPFQAKRDLTGSTWLF